MAMTIDGTAGLTFNNATTQASSSKVLQVVNATYSTTVSSTTSTYVDTGLTATITPLFSTSKILVLVNQNGLTKSSGVINADMKLKVVRNSTDIINVALYSFYTNTSTDLRGQTLSTSYLDSPATTTATTYKTQFAAAENVGTVSVQNEGAGSVSTITLMEIAA